MKITSIIIVITTMFLCSCCGGLERKAKKQMKETMFELAKNPETFKIDDIKTIINNDSLCVLQFTTRGQNGFGGYSINKMEYCYVKDNKKEGNVKYHECIVDLEDIEKNERPHAASIKSVLNNTDIRKDEDFLKFCKEKKQTLEEGVKDFAYAMALINCTIWGREVEQE